MRSPGSLEASSARFITGRIAISITIAWPISTMHHGSDDHGRPPKSPGRISCGNLRDPLKLGYNTTIWTVPLLASHLSRRYDAQITPRTLRRRMKEVGLRWERPRY